MNTEQERAEFEAWARKHGQPVFRDDEEPECYAYSNVQDNWTGWQARAALAAQPAASAEHATCNLQLATQEPVACAFFDEKGEVAYTGIYDRTLKALERVKTTRMGISSGSIDLYAAPVAAQAPAADADALLDALRKIAAWPDGGNRYGQKSIKRLAQAAIDAALARDGA